MLSNKQAKKEIFTEHLNFTVASIVAKTPEKHSKIEETMKQI